MKEKTEKKWYRFFWNKYVLVGTFFLIWMIFFDQNSYLMHRDLDHDISELEKDKAYFENVIVEESILLHELKTNPAETERIAREKYYMKKDSEDIFLIIEQDTGKIDTK